MRVRSGAGYRTWAFGNGGLVRVQDFVDGRIAVGMHRHLMSLAVGANDELVEGFLAATRVSAVRGISIERRVIGCRKVAREALDGAILDDLDGAEPQAIPIHGREDFSGCGGISRRTGRHGDDAGAVGSPFRCARTRSSILLRVLLLAITVVVTPLDT